MKRYFLITVLLAGSLICASGQTVGDSITMKRVFGGYQFYQGEQRLNMNQLVTAMKPNDQAFQEIQSAQSTYYLAMVVSGAGGFKVRWPLGTAVAGGEPNWLLTHSTLVCRQFHPGTG